MKKSASVSTGGFSLGTVLTIIFIVLKLVGVITWPWIWVLAPLWIGVALFLVVFIIMLLFAGIVSKF